MKNPTPSKIRLDKLLSNLGYASRGEIHRIIAQGRVTVGGDIVTKADLKVFYDDVRLDGEALDPAFGLVILMHKPPGLVCSHDDGEGAIVYDLLPPRWRLRDPKISTVGRLDKETSGLLLLTDDGQLIHRLTSPRRHVAKRYEVTLERPLRGDEGEIFASGTLLLNGEKNPCLAARLEKIDATHAILEITEGRYHQVRRMFAAVGNHVTALHRASFGTLTLGDLKPGEFRILLQDEIPA
jgi:16S rRNA pseudouridine516 synthase